MNHTGDKEPTKSSIYNDHESSQIGITPFPDKGIVECDKRSEKPRYSGLFGILRRILERHDAEVNLAWGRPLLRFWDGIEILSTTNGKPVSLISRHPRQSITWTWLLWWSGGWDFYWSTQKPMWRQRRPNSSTVKHVEHSSPDSDGDHTTRWEL